VNNGTPVGTYASSCSGGSATNYTLAFVNGTSPKAPVAATIILGGVQEAPAA